MDLLVISALICTFLCVLLWFVKKEYKKCSDIDNALREFDIALREARDTANEVVDAIKKCRQ